MADNQYQNPTEKMLYELVTLLTSMYDTTSHSLSAKVNLAVALDGSNELLIDDAHDSIKIGNGSGQYASLTGTSLNVNITGGATAGTQYADGVTQATPTGTAILGKNASNILHTLSLDSSGNLNVNLAAGSISGGNAAASATGAAVPASAGYTGYNSGGNLVGVSTANPLPVAQQGSVTIAALTNASVVKVQLQDNGGTAITLGQKAMASSVPVVLASDQSALAVTGTFWQGTQPVSGTVTANAGSNLNTSALALDATLTGGTQQTKITDGTNVATVKAASTAAQAADKAVVVAISPNNTVAVTGTFWQGTQPISGSVSVSNFPASQAVTGTFWQSTQPVSIASMPSTPVTGTFWQSTQPVSIASMPTTAVTLAAGATSIGKAEDVASADADVGVPSMAIQKASPADTAGTDGDYAMLQMSAGRLWTSSKIDTALPAGAALIGKVGIDQTTPGTTNGVQINAALPAGANAIGKLAANSGVIIGAVEIAAAQTIGLAASSAVIGHVIVDTAPTTAVTLAAGAAAIAKAEDSPSADLDVGVPAMAIQKASPADTAGTDGDYAMLQMSAGRLWASAKIDTALPAGAALIGKVGIDQTTPGTTNGVQVNAALPAGTNAIGKLAANSGVTIGAVEIAAAQTIGLAAGAAVIGHVINDAGSAIMGKVGIDQTAPGTTNGVQVVAAIPAGTNLMGKVGIDQTTPGTTNGVQVVAALPTGANAIGKLAANSGVTIGAVEIAAAQTLATVTTVSTVSAARVVGNTGAVLDAADNAAAPANSIQAGGVYNTTIPALTSGNAAAQRLDSTGAVYSNNEGRKQTFSCALVDFVPLASATVPCVAVTGSATKVVRITRIAISATASTGAVATLNVRRLSALSGGTSASQSGVIAKHDTNNASATAVVTTWSVAATTATAAGILRSLRFEYPTPAVTVQPNLYEWTFGDKNSQALVVRGTGDFIGLCFNGIATSPVTDIYIEWTEE